MHTDQNLPAENNTFIIQVIPTCKFNHNTFLLTIYCLQALRNGSISSYSIILTFEDQGRMFYS